MVVKEPQEMPATPGTGAAGGGVVVVIAKTVSGNGTIRADGDDGSAPTQGTAGTPAPDTQTHTWKHCTTLEITTLMDTLTQVIIILMVILILVTTIHIQVIQSLHLHTITTIIIIPTTLLHQLTIM